MHSAQTIAQSDTAGILNRGSGSGQAQWTAPGGNGITGMIGVLADEADHPVVREFFELFKTPWEFHRSDRQYEVIICANDRRPENTAKLVLIYGAGPRPNDRDHGVVVSAPTPGALLSCRGNAFPIYGNCVTFRGAGIAMLRDQRTREPAAVESTAKGQKRVRFGFDLFHEVRHLLTRGQPAQNAAIPALEMHIAVLRDLIIGAEITLVEIPPVPAGYSFMACLTHDVDHPGIRNHKWDHTTFGFLYRATVGSCINVFRGRRTLKELGANWMAAFSLPFVHLGWAKDFWRQFDHYLELEKGLGSTFFLIPNKNDPGQTADGRRPKKRAAQYDVAELTGDLQKVAAAGNEIGLHGIDAWRDSGKGREELARLSRISGTSVTGVRMHWLYFDEQAPAVLEKAGLSYDSTVGYNETAGYRAGTTQAFKPLGLEQMMELPMHVMDTALFYPAYRNLAPKEAKNVVASLIENANRFGGVLTVNWHDRSIAPERLWDTFYVDLLEDLKSRGAWFPTASQAVAWFKMRRSAMMETVCSEDKPATVKVSVKRDNNLPGLRLRIHQRRAATRTQSEPSMESVEVAFREDIEVPLAAAVHS
jgi:peptidoglycan/xylan/chitin deacetylase (PgdA/CDA1 family)